ncbi:MULTISPECIES: FMN-binding glutamate synthase family protein [Leeuwenhoekiella]|uniref:Glutamate synthase domain-containing protein 2 n=1 Tax=Leeuwenhoekiella palythoae TaxID=573501 RepID=A0A1M5ZQ82_9FLAO|nr:MULTISPECIES: FMN-binding glutamate synthase family protein [Leeuwenhoekiella]SHI26515.1 Glutamate synthase domain-containing protein 2 [Leeuwenhoekiella palythoae]|tara:strand:+ start:13657 stop:15156 length:1500 start_codon:yes stop_codon:yes gene_type:complete
MRRGFIVTSIILILALAAIIILYPLLWWLALILLPILVLGLIDYFQKSNNIRRTYPLLGRITNLLEKQRHVVQETVLLNRTEGKPFNWIQKEIVYKRAEDAVKNQPFGTQIPYDEVGREWFTHSTYPAKEIKDDFRVTIGSSKCSKPYSASILNLAGMSYGSISKNATLAFNGGAKIAGFAQNTGEGGFTPYHQEYGADVIFQFGTGYFGCRTEEGDFDPKKFAEIASNEVVKMIEIKVSQGAKPGFGAILPAKKNTEEIAKYRDVEKGTEILSPPHHAAFSNDSEMIAFIQELRKLSGGKPIGIKMCIGQKDEFERMVRTFAEKKNYPDFIAIDGAEGGSGAAHMESLHWAGLPIIEAIHFANGILKKYGLRDEIKVMAAGKIISAFDIYRMLALGADTCYSARGMMFALGCVQSLKCNLDTCPTGITTMEPSRVASLVVEDKKTKVANYHKNTIEAFKELLKSMGIENRRSIDKKYIIRRINENDTKTYDEIFIDNK